MLQDVFYGTEEHGYPMPYWTAAHYGNLLNAAARGGNLSTLQLLMRLPPRANALSRLPQSLLSLGMRVEAAFSGHLSIVKELSTVPDRSPDYLLDSTDYHRIYLRGTLEQAASVYVAAEGGHLEVLKYLVVMVEQYLPKDWHEKTLMIGARAGHLHIFDYILEKLAGTSNIQGLCHPSKGASPLCAAAQRGQFHIVQRILTLGVDPNKYSSLARHPASCAATSGQTRVLEYLLDHGCNVNIFEKKPQIFWSADEPKDRATITLMSMAARGNRTDAMRVLLRRGFDVHAHGCNAGLTAARKAARGGHAAALRLLLEAGVEPALVLGSGELEEREDMVRILEGTFGKLHVA